VSKRERDKGLRGELEVKHLFEDHRWSMRGLEGEGDHIATKWRMINGLIDPNAPALVVHVEVKRQERLALPAWLRQAEGEAPDGTVPVVCFRQSRSKWYVAVELEKLLELIG